MPIARAADHLCLCLALCLPTAAGYAQEAQRLEEPLIRPDGEITLAERGFENARLVHSGRRMDYYQAPDRRGNDLHVFVHKVGWEERRPIVAVGSGSYDYNPAMLAEIEEAILAGGGFENSLHTRRAGHTRYHTGRFQVVTLHYYQGYASPFAHRRESYERPVALLLVRNAEPSEDHMGSPRFTIKRDSLGGQSRVPGSPIAMCMQDQRSLTGAELPAAQRVCGGGGTGSGDDAGPERLLLAAGIAEAREVGRDDGVRYFTGAIPGCSSNCVAAVYDAGIDDRIAPVVSHPHIANATQYDLEPLKAALRALDPEPRAHGRVEASVYSFAAGVDYESLAVDRKGLTVGAIYAGISRYRDGTWRSASRGNPYNPAPESVADAVRRYDQVLRNRAVINAVKDSEMSRSELRAALEIAKTETAEQLGYAVRPDAYWDPFRDQYRRQFDRTPSSIPAKRVLDGAFNAARTEDSAPLISRYVELMNDRCPSQLPPDAIALNVVTTEGAHMDGGVYQPPREMARRTLKVDPRFAVAFASNLNSTNDATMSDAVSALRNLFQRGTMPFDIPGLVLSAWSVNYLFEREPCDGAVLEQFADNLYRMMVDAPSIQTERARLLADMAPAGDDASFDDKLLFQTLETDPGLAWYRFHQTPAGWLPPSPHALLERARADYLPLTYRPFTQELAPIRVHATVVEPGPDSLEAVGVYIFGDTPGNSRLFDVDLAASGQERNTDAGMYRLANPERKPDVIARYQRLAVAYPANFVVECRYQNGSVMAFWLDRTPPDARSEALKAEVANHPVLAIGPQRDHCPSTHDGAAYLLEPLVIR